MCGGPAGSPRADDDVSTIVFDAFDAFDAFAAWPYCAVLACAH